MAANSVITAVRPVQRSLYAAEMRSSGAGPAVLSVLGRLSRLGFAQCSNCLARRSGCQSTRYSGERGVAWRSVAWRNKQVGR